MKTLAILLFSFLLLPLAVLAQEDEEGTKDHPDIPRMPGYYILSSSEKEFAPIEFPLEGDKAVTKEGRYLRIEYRLKEDQKDPGATAVVRNYQNAFQKKGGKVLYKYDDGSSAETTLSMPLGKSERWMMVRAGSGAYDLEIVEVKAMEQKVEVSASEMLDALNKDGFIALQGILFDTGKDTIKPESEPLLAEIVTLMKSNPGLKISIEGHTDNVGQPKMNQQLSQKRADSVKKWLVKNGVEAGRLLTKGWGDTKPIADNRTEDGRAKNRRVELVKK
jgi:outer membrane protein OmpA-like peptidoglycan-associated protein